VDCIDEVQEEKKEDERGEEELEEERRLRMEALALAHASCPHATDTMRVVVGFSPPVERRESRRQGMVKVEAGAGW